ncbi:MAG: EAL domain-containing protein [Actinomycetota bacterium]|nr:EAL domain-containing protein [Actinomycetota bacterium]
MDHLEATATETIGVDTTDTPDESHHRCDDAELARVLGGLAQNRVIPYYQPQVELGSGRVVGLEALARWICGTGEVFGPETFVPVLERHRRVTELTARMLDRAARDLSLWRDAGLVRTAFCLAINVSATELGDRRIVEVVDGTLDRHGLVGADLCLEITETAPIDDLEAATAVLTELRERVGVRIAIDDYGTGHATPTYLEHLPADIVKIDRSFVAAVRGRRSRSFICDTIARAAHRGMTVVAEGVERVEQLDDLLGLGCTVGQGFHIAVPTEHYPADLAVA